MDSIHVKWALQNLIYPKARLLIKQKISLNLANKIIIINDSNTLLLLSQDKINTLILIAQAHKSYDKMLAEDYKNLNVVVMYSLLHFYTDGLINDLFSPDLIFSLEDKWLSTEIPNIWMRHLHISSDILTKVGFYKHFKFIYYNKLMPCITLVPEIYIIN